MAKYRIEHDREGCIGCGACASICGKNWQIANDGKSKPNKTAIDDKELKCNMDAAKACPVNVIHIIDEKGEKRI